MSEEGAGFPETGAVMAVSTTWVPGTEYSSCGKSNRCWESRQSGLRAHAIKGHQPQVYFNINRHRITDKSFMSLIIT